MTFQTAHPNDGFVVPGPLRFGPGKDLGGLRQFWLQSAQILEQTWTDPAAASTTALIATPLAGPNATTATTLKGSAGWDGTLGATGLIPHPRNVVWTVTHATSIVAMSAVVTGLDIHGNVATEALAVTATGTTKTATGNVAFMRVDSIAVTAAGNATANSHILGTGTKFGLYAKCAVASPVKEIAAGSVVTNGTLVAASAVADNDDYGTYSPNTAPNGSNDYTIYYLCTNPLDT